MTRSIVVDASVVVKWFKKGEAGEQRALKVRDDIFSARTRAIVPEWLFLEVVRGLVKVDYPLEKIEDAYSTLRESASLGLIEAVPMNRLLDTAKEAEIGLKLFASDAVYLAAAVVSKASLLTSDKHLLSRRVQEYAEKQGIRILPLD